jgi:hypothetical protein
LFCSDSLATIVYATAGSTYSQNFDSLPNTPENVSLGSSPTGWIDDTATPASGQFSIVGFYLWHPMLQTEGGSNGHQRVRIGAGTANTGAFMSFGASGSTERALGMVNSNTLAAAGTGEAFYGARFTNSTGTTLNQFTLSYDGEQWRDGGAATPIAQSITFGYKVNAANLQDAGFTPVAALNFSSPVFTNTGSGAGVNGNGVGNVAIGPVSVSGVNWLPGTDLWIRWTDVNNAGNDHGLSIDDLAFTAAVPEPGAVLSGAVVCGVIGLAAAGRRLVTR